MFDELLAPVEEVLGPLVPGAVWLMAGFALGIALAGTLRPVVKTAVRAGMGVGDRVQAIGSGAARRPRRPRAGVRPARPARPAGPARAARPRRPRPAPARPPGA